MASANVGYRAPALITEEEVLAGLQKQIAYYFSAKNLQRVGLPGTMLRPLALARHLRAGLGVHLPLAGSFSHRQHVPGHVGTVRSGGQLPWRSGKRPPAWGSLMGGRGTGSEKQKQRKSRGRKQPHAHPPPSRRVHQARSTYFPYVLQAMQTIPTLSMDSGNLMVQPRLHELLSSA